MQTIKEFLKTTTAKRALWTILNSIMALGAALMVYLATEKDLVLAASVVPVFQALSQFITKYLNQ